MREMLALAMLALPAVALGADLDAPLRPEPPTLRSEIQRGADAAGSCADRYGDDLSGQTYLQCLTDAQHANRQSIGRGYEPFEAGLWYCGRERLRATVTVAPSPLSTAAFGVAASSLQSAELGPGLSDADVIRAIYGP